MYVDGEWVPSVSGRWRPDEDPSTGEVFAEVPDGVAEDVDRAVAAARRAFDEGPWPRLTPSDRRGHLLRLAEALARRAEYLVSVVGRDTGCPIRMAEMFQVAAPVGHLGAFADQALLLEEPRALPITDAPSFGQSEIRRVPMGVCAAFVPFNFPLFMSIWKFGQASAMGNTVVLKASPLTPLGTNELARACAEVGFPAGVINVVHGDVEVGERLARHRGVDRISFTGSTAVGRKVMEMAAATVKRVTLELGGKSPSIVLDDADLELAVRGSLFGSLIHAGQACVATTRLLAPASRYDEIVDRLSERVAPMTVGPWDDYATDVGPLISRAQLEKVEAYVGSAVDEGAKILTGGRRVELGGGYYHEPTVLVGVRNDMKVACDEVFGPVLSVIRYDGDAEAVRIANDSIYGLGATVWGGDLSRARGVASRIRAGSVWVNDFGALDPRTPFGGFKQSGFGREFSAEGAFEYTELQHIYTALDQDHERRPYSLVCLDWD
jgi:aldehyde dehydrogenase (NAD+)